MWIKLKETYIGPLGTFPKDYRQDVPDDTAKQLIADGFAFGTCAPWDDEKDKKTAKKLAQKEQMLTQEASLGKQIADSEKFVEATEANAKLLPARKKFLAELKKKYEAVCKQLKPFLKGKENEPDNTAAADGEGSEPKDDANSAGQAASTGQE